MKNTTLSIAILGIALISSLVLSACSSGGGCCSGEQRIEKDTKNVKAWTCSMHPEVKSPTPGKCPICSMNLIPAKK